MTLHPLIDGMAAPRDQCYVAAWSRGLSLEPYERTNGAE